MFKFTTVKMLRAAIIAAVYSTVTIFLGFLSYGPVQIRFAEALTVLPVLFPEAVIGVTLGCLISNIFSPFGFLWLDTVFGTLATFCAAVLTYYVGRFFRLNNFEKRKPNNLDETTVIKEKTKAGVLLAALPPVLVNAFVIPFVIFAYIKDDMAAINIFTSNSFLLYILGFTSVLIGQAIAVYGIGIPFYFGVKKGMSIYSAQAVKKRQVENKSESDE
jgi:hypothetical protein